MSNPYSVNKIDHHPLHLEALRKEAPIAPIHVQLIPTNVCNHNCSFCSYRQSGYSSNQSFDDRESIPFSKLAQIVEDCETMGVRAIQLTGGGEPTCHSNFIKLCELILESGIDLAVVTNGTLWKQKHIEVIRKAKWVRFSIDAGQSQTYSDIRNIHQNRYTKVREVIRELTSKDLKPTVGVGFVVTKDNWEEILLATIAAKADRVDNIRISAVFQDEGSNYFKSFEEEAEELCRRAENLSTDNFKVINLFGDRLNDLSQGRPDYSDCHFSKLCTYIGADLNIYSCCVYAYNELGLLGSIKDRSFKEVWFDSETQKHLNEFDARACERCMFNNKNRAIDYRLSYPETKSNTIPDHVNFI